MKLVDCLKQTITATNLATMTMGSAVSGFRTVAQAISHGDLAVGDTDVPMMVRVGALWEFSLFTVTSPTLLTRQRVLASWNGGDEVTFPAGSKEAFCTVPAEYLSGTKVTDLPTFPSSAAGDTVLLYRPSTGTLGTLLASAFGAGNAGSGADTVGPAFASGAAMTSSSVTSSGFTLTWPAATDAVGVSKYEYSYDASTWTNAGNVLTVAITGRVASTLYTMRLRAVDAAGNTSNVLTLAVTTAAAAGGGDTVDPTMSGSLTTASVTADGFVMNWSAGSDNVGVVGYDTSIDGGATWTQQGTATTRTVAGATASTLYNLRVRARDAANRTSNVLSATVTTDSAAPSYSGPDYLIMVREGVDNAGPSTLGYCERPASPSARPVMSKMGFRLRTAATGGISTAEGVTVKGGWRKVGQPTPTFADLGEQFVKTGWSSGDPNTHTYFGLWTYNGGTPYIDGAGANGSYEYWVGTSEGFIKKYTENGSPYILVVT